MGRLFGGQKGLFLARSIYDVCAEVEIAGLSQLGGLKCFAREVAGGDVLE